MTQGLQHKRMQGGLPPPGCRQLLNFKLQLLRKAVPKACKAFTHPHPPTYITPPPKTYTHVHAHAHREEHHVPFLHSKGLLFSQNAATNTTFECFVGSSLDFCQDD